MRSEGYRMHVLHTGDSRWKEQGELYGHFNFLVSPTLQSQKQPEAQVHFRKTITELVRDFIL